ncbi:MAG TPA: CheR family methyltransferase [Anseongella sp.]|nr:CheR family methyltransferase [Anseongella sp.]
MDDTRKSLLKDDEIELLLNDLHSTYGYDFRDYARASLKRRINHQVQADHIPSFAELIFRLRTDAGYAHRFADGITVNVTEMFRDPGFYRILRENVLPVLATRPFIRIWHAGCASGEEVYSMAILLKEANLLRRSLLYATDLSPSALEKVKKGIFPLRTIKQYSENYIESGGREDFSNYYAARYDYAKFDESLKERMIISTHNLVSDASFNEFQLILCRNVFIYFERVLQEKVLKPLPRPTVYKHCTNAPVYYKAG